MAILHAFNLEGKVAWFTGAARGLGQAMAVGLAEAGADIVNIDRNQAEDTCQQIRALGQRMLMLTEDLSGLTPQRAEVLVKEIIVQQGKLDIIVNNAGLSGETRLLNLPRKTGKWFWM